MKFSYNLSSLPEYPFARMEEIIRKRRSLGQKILAFNIGDPDLPTPDFITDALIYAVKRNDYAGYSSADGEPWFREAVAEWYRRRFGVEIDPESEVCALIGSKEGLANIARAFVDKDDTVLYPDPGYPVYANGAARLSGGKAVRYVLKNDSFLPDLSDASPLHAKLLYLNYPHNPTGAVIDREELAGIVEEFASSDTILCYDNAYSEITFSGYTAPSVLQCSKDHTGLVEFHSCSKTFCMTGYRIGFAVGDKRAIDALKKVKSQIDSGPPKFIQYAASVALQSYTGSSKPNSVQEVADVYYKRMSELCKGLEELGYKAKMPRATFYLWQKTDDASYAEKLLERGILVTPGNAFGDAGKNYVRWSLTQPMEVIYEALELMKRL
ncbi:MAG: aminotransferase class I/II-fold pyridoxal phosphate-dependent enzyme [Conexivisphaerales archaeon]